MISYFKYLFNGLGKKCGNDISWAKHLICRIKLHKC